MGRFLRISTFVLLMAVGAALFYLERPVPKPRTAASGDNGGAASLNKSVEGKGPRPDGLSLSPKRVPNSIEQDDWEKFEMDKELAKKLNLSPEEVKELTHAMNRVMKNSHKMTRSPAHE